jgi:hypoxanthine phosphoribosyltransferase
MLTKEVTEKERYEILYSEDEIKEMVDSLGEEITRRYEEEQDTDLVILVVLNGAMYFAADLTREIEHPNLYVESVVVSSYGLGNTSSREPIVKFTKEPNFLDKNILIVEDIVDTGHSINQLIAILEDYHPKNIEVCALLSKDERREVEAPIHHLGASIPDKWVIGYGLDDGGIGRAEKDISYKLQ